MKKIYLNTLTPEEIIKSLKNGEVIKTPNGELKIIDGILTKLYYDGDFTINIDFYVDPESKNENSYFEEQEEFKIEKTGLYKTRNGKTAFVSFIGEEDIYGMVDGFEAEFCWHKDGFRLMSIEDDFDLVEYIGA